MNEIYVVGHRNPDTDSIVAAMSYAALRNALGDRDYVAAYLGHVSDETQRLLNRFGFQPPQLIQNVRTQVSDLDYDTPPALNATVTMDRAWHIMREQRISAMDAQEREALRRRDMDRLNSMVEYCRTGGCLRGCILGYFGQEHPESCGACANCRSLAAMWEAYSFASAWLMLLWSMPSRMACRQVTLSMYPFRLSLTHSTRSLSLSITGLAQPCFFPVGQ